MVLTEDGGNDENGIWGRLYLMGFGQTARGRAFCGSLCGVQKRFRWISCQTTSEALETQGEVTRNLINSKDGLEYKTDSGMCGHVPS